MSEVKFSIIIPVFNVESYLSECLQSVIDQDLTEFEIICIEDCSNDTSKVILQSFAKRDNRIVVVQHEKNQGVGTARNSGMGQATGKYILFLDGDDFLTPNILGNIYQMLKQDKLEILQFAHEIKIEVEIAQEYCGKYNRVVRKNKNLWNSEIMNGSDYFLYVQENQRFCGMVWSYVFQRQFLSDHRFLFEKLTAHEDGIFVMKSLLASKRVKMTDAIVYTYRKRQNSLTANPSFQYYLDNITVCKHLKELCLEQKIPEEWRIWIGKKIRHRLNKGLKALALRKEWRNQLNVLVESIEKCQLEEYLIEGPKKKFLFQLLQRNLYLFVFFFWKGYQFKEFVKIFKKDKVHIG